VTVGVVYVLNRVLFPNQQVNDVACFNYYRPLAAQQAGRLTPEASVKGEVVVDKAHRLVDTLEEDDLAKATDCRSVGSWSENRSRHVSDCLKVAMSVLHPCKQWRRSHVSLLRSAPQQASTSPRRLGRWAPNVLKIANYHCAMERGLCTYPDDCRPS
jgi:hypothetical protein